MDSKPGEPRRIHLYEVCDVRLEIGMSLVKFFLDLTDASASERFFQNGEAESLGRYYFRRQQQEYEAKILVEKLRANRALKPGEGYRLIKQAEELLKKYK